MTPDTPEAAESKSIGEWFQANSRAASIASGLIAVVVVSVWFYMRSAEIKRLNAERGLNQAKQSLSAGNAALAATDLQRVATRYMGTPGGAHAAMLLAQLRYDEAKHAEGLQVLEPYLSSGASGALLPDVLALVGEGQMSMGNAIGAAATYQKAADATNLPGTRALLRAKAARALMVGGKPLEAQAVWERLVADPEAAAVKNEAEIRLGELATKPAGRN